jgi:hypothetical protein
MPIHDDGQHFTNIIQSDSSVKTGDMALLLQKPFGRAITFTLAAGNWSIDRHDGVGAIPYNEDHYDPTWPVTGITTNDDSTTGGTARVDLESNTNARNVNIRIFSGLDRPYHVTRLYLSSITNVNSVVLLG